MPISLKILFKFNNHIINGVTDDVLISDCSALFSASLYIRKRDAFFMEKNMKNSLI